MSPPPHPAPRPSPPDAAAASLPQGLGPGSTLPPARPRRRWRQSEGTGAGCVYPGPRTRTPLGPGVLERVPLGRPAPAAASPRAETGAHAPCGAWPACSGGAPRSAPPRARTRPRQHARWRASSRGHGVRAAAQPARLPPCGQRRRGRCVARARHSGPGPSGPHAGLGCLQRAAAGKVAPALACPGPGSASRSRRTCSAPRLLGWAEPQGFAQTGVPLPAPWVPGEHPSARRGRAERAIPSWVL